MPKKYKTVDILVGSYVIPSDVIKRLDCIWSFVNQYYPKYSSSDYISYGDDLQKLVDHEVNGNAAKLLRDNYNDDINDPQINIDYLNVCNDIYERAIQGFINSLK